MIAANRSAEVTLSKFLRVIRPCFGGISVIGGNIALESDLEDVGVHSFRIERAGNKLKRMLCVVALQIKMSVKVLRSVKRDEPVFFWVGDKMIAPYLAAKAKRAAIYYYIYGNVAKEGTASRFSRMSAGLIRFMANHADCICLESKSVLGEWEGRIAGRTKTIHLYTEDAGFNGIEDRRNIIGMVCRLTEAKHVVESIEAFSRLHEVFPEWSLEIIGSGKQYEECMRTVDALSGAEYIRLLGWIEHGRIREITKRWKYLLFPTDTEGLPNGLIEMMGQGIPAIASPAGGIRDVVVHGQNGWALKGVSVTDLFDGMMEALNAPDYPGVAAAAHNRIASEYTLETARRLAKSEILSARWDGD
jgi:glycosyltransferase involved in cell wall biosynthesis